MKRLVFFIGLLLIPLCLSATTWYVRPAGGTYGNEYGTTYADAWDGILNVVWGVGGVVAGDTLYVCGSHYYDIQGFTGNNVPTVDAESAKNNFNKLSKAINEGLVRACHDCSEGGLAVALAEMAFSGGFGAEIDLRKVERRSSWV